MLLPSSIRWRLPLSYGAVALLATICLGAVLLFTLQKYYTRQEEVYLERNALAFAEFLKTYDDSELEQLFLQSQVNTFAYLTQTRVRIWDVNGRLLADSGDPLAYQAIANFSLEVQIDDTSQAFSQTVTEDNLTSILVIERDGNRFESETTVVSDHPQLATLAGIATPYSFLETLYGFGQTPNTRSQYILRMGLYEFVESNQWGTIELSQGPAFGQAILTGVIWSVFVAAIIAVLLATLVGWRMSLRLSRPIQQLAQAADQMASGQLQARTHIQRRDEIGQLAVAFNEMGHQIERTIATLRNFVADAAHELNTPLTALRTNLDLAANQHPQSDLINQAQHQAQRLETLNDNLLSLSRLEGDINHITRTPLDLVALWQQRSEFYAAQAEQAQLTLTMQLPPEPLYTTGNPTYLQRALDNLIDNAIKFTPIAGTITLQLTYDNHWSYTTITDSGIGIPIGSETAVFDRFHRASNAINIPGSGLGLAIVATVAKIHGGTVTAKQTTQGSQFTLQLPITKEP